MRCGDIPGKITVTSFCRLLCLRKMKFRDFAETTAFRQVARTITALSTQDERIATNFEQLKEDAYQAEKSSRLKVMCQWNEDQAR